MPHESLREILIRINEARVHRLIVVDENRRVTGIVSLSDIFGFFLGPVDGEDKS